jgi:hypothetical protein
MKRQLIFVHGRSQEHNDAKALKTEWLAALQGGLAKSNLRLPIEETDVRFPFYGNTLFDMVDGKAREEAAAVIIRGEGAVGRTCRSGGPAQRTAEMGVVSS